MTRARLMWLAVLAAFLIMVATIAFAQQTKPDWVVGGVFNSVAPTYSNRQVAPFQVDTNGNLKVNIIAGGGSGGTSSTFGAAFPATGTAAGFDDGSGNMAAATVDGSNNLNVNCVVGCAGGSFNNNSDGVATSATNGQAAAWLYGFNGTTFDRLRVDGSKNLDVNVQVSALPSGAATSALQTTGNSTLTTINTSLGTINTTLGSPFQAGGSIGNTAFIANAGTNLNTSALALETGGNLATTATNTGTTATNTGTIAGAVSSSKMNVNLSSITGTNVPVGATNSTGTNQAQIQCDSFKFVHVTSATDTLLVQGVTAKTVRVCGVVASFSGSAAQSFFLENTASTNANCSSANTQITALITGNATTPMPYGWYNPTWGGLANTSANGLCVNTSGTGGVDIQVWYEQG